MGVECGATHQSGFHFKLQVKCLQDLDGLGHDFGTDSVTRQNCDFHCLVLLF